MRRRPGPGPAARPVRHRALLLGVALWLAAATAAVPAQARACTVLAPADWPTNHTLRWEGLCPGGQADGLGVLRSYEAGQLRRLFYGRMHAGAPRLGVVELPEQGFQAGEFRQGLLLPTDDRALTIRAFDEAAAAARMAAERFRAAGNKASAAYYLGKAKRLAEQMD